MPYRLSRRYRENFLFLLLSVLPALAVGLVSYDFVYDYVRSEGTRDAGLIADIAHKQLSTVLVRANDRAKSFLLTLGTQCRNRAKRTDQACAEDLIRSYLVAEGALGATLWRSGTGLSIGKSAIRREEDWKFQSGQLARLAGSEPGNGRIYFVTAAAPGGLQLAVTYSSSRFQPIFESVADGGESGEVFLVDGQGNLVAKSSHAPADYHPIDASTMRACLSGNNSEVAALDYRGAESGHGFRAVPELGGGCIMAQIGRVAAFAPLARAEKTTAAILLVFMIPVVLVARYIARRIARTDAALRGTQSLNQSILATSAAGFAAYRQDGRCVMVNPACCKMVGGTERQILSLNFRSLASWRASGLADCAEIVLATGLDRDYETELTTTYGRRIWLRCHLSRFFTQGQPHLMLMCQDVTDARRAEQALKESEEFNSRVIASSSDCIKVLNLEGNLISMSESGQRMLEIADIGRYLGSCWINFWHDEDRQEVVAAIAAARRGEVGRFAAYCPTEKGMPKWWDVVITPILSAGGQIERLLAVSRDVTARKEEEEQFKMMIRTSLDGFWITDERGNLLEVNDAYCELSGYSRKELLEISISDLDAIETPEDTARHIQVLMASGSVRFETRHRCKDGHLVDIDVSAKYTAKYGGKIYCFLRDITARKHSDRLLQRQRDHLEQEVQRRTAELTAANQALAASFREIDDLYQNAPCGYHSVDEHGVILRMNDTELSWLGYARGEVIGKMRIQELLTPPSLADFHVNFPLVRESGAMYGVKADLVRKDGSIISALLNISSIRNAQGHFMMSRVTVYDMTEQKKIEQTQLRLNRALRLLSAGNAALIHAQDEQGLLDSICRLVVETGGYLMAWVGVAGDDAEYSIRPVASYGDHDGYLDSIHISWTADGPGGQGPTGRAIRLASTQVNQHWASNRSLRPWFEAARKRGFQSSIALPIVRDGCALGALNMYSGDPGAFVPEEVQLLEELASNLAFGVEALRMRAREVSANNELKLHRSHLEVLVAQRTAELSAAKVEAEHANSAKSRFLAAASHDLRQPLTALKLYVGVLKNSLDPDKTELVVKMQECIGGLSNLLSKLLDLSKLDGGVVKPQVRDFAVDDMINEVFAAHAPDAESKGLSLRCSYNGLIARTDPVLFQRIVGNLVANAVRYTEHGGVLMGCRRRQGKMWLEIWDTGVGIPPDKTGEIFEEFKQLGDDARTQGSGLGLTIVAKTADLLDLEIRVQSRPGQGSMFAIELPPGKRLRPLVYPTAPKRSQGVRIAMVDDNPMVLHALACSLEDAGHTVVAAASGGELLGRLGAVAPEITVCDHRLAGGETGFDVIESVRAVFGDDVPAVIITGDTDPKLMRNMARRGIVILHKPIELAELEQRIEDAVSRPVFGAN